MSDTSPDWVGSGWYRMMVGAGASRIPESPPGVNQCGAWATGWMKGSHPTVAGQTKELVTFCFDGKGFHSGTDCGWKTQGKVTHCGDYFVYYLENTPACTLRYCATDRFQMISFDINIFGNGKRNDQSATIYTKKSTALGYFSFCNFLLQSGLL